MRLVKATVGGFKRFLDPTSIVFNARLTAVVGPNESGKSSLLEALQQFSSRTTDTQARTRGTEADPTVVVLFELEPVDRESISDIPGADSIRALQLTATSQGRTWELFPHRPARDLSARKAALDSVVEASESAFNWLGLGEGATSIPSDVSSVLASPADTLNEQAIERIDTYATSLREALEAHPPITPEEGAEPAELVAFESSSAAHAAVTTLEQQLVALAGIERHEAPSSLAARELIKRIPKFIKFGAADRDLRSQYSLEALREAVPTALQNLFALCDFDMNAYLQAVDDGDDTLRKRLEMNANMVLKSKFTERWSQSRLSLELELGTDRVVIYVRPEDGSDFARFDERSDGLRIFVALLAFIWNAPDQPVLMLDELETHLHYDAQADLVDILSRQDFTSHVLYTTHSVGCLPQDLGGAVKAVEAVGDQRSQIVANLWQGTAGFRPLMAAMGAAAMSFTPSRYALLTEGISECTLLPTLMRQLPEVGQPEFHIAPGLASLADPNAVDLHTDAGSVAFLVDGDSAGQKLRQRLVALGIPEERILSLADLVGPDIVVEDLIDLPEYTRAVNAEISFWSDDTSPPVIAEHEVGGDPGRPSRVRDWCRSRSLPVPDKMRVAGRVAEMADEERVRRLKDTHDAPGPFLASANAASIALLKSTVDAVLGLA